MKLRYRPEELIFSYSSRCPCGKGLAYPKGIGPYEGYWDCSGIWTGTALTGRKHTAKLPFTFYKIREERDGISTREDLFE